MVSFRFSGKKSMTRIGRIFTDTHYPCVSASSAQSAFYPIDNKPQRAQRTQREVSILCALCVICGRLIISTAKDFDKTTHHKERKAIQQESLRPLRSLRLNIFFAPAPERAQPAVHLRTSRAEG
ncbi:Uncharacterised protein [uncultured archaeon]|nr:Uncharacterised protein [uncultured archaeon]